MNYLRDLNETYRV